jgi:hypothetical protein
MRAPSIISLASLAAVGLSACGSTTQSAGAARPSPGSTAPLVSTTPSRIDLKITGPTATGSCAAAIGSELSQIGRNVAMQALNGRNMTASLLRLTSSRPLADAVARGDRAAIPALLPKLVRNQVVRLEVTDRRGRLLARRGRTRAFYPRTGTLRAPDGSVVGHVRVAVSPDAALVGIVHAVTGDQVVLTGAGGHRIIGTFPSTPTPAPGAHAVTGHGVRYTVSTFASEQFPKGKLQVHLLTPPQPQSLCASQAAETRMNTIASVGRKLVAAESNGPGVAHSLRYAARLPSMRQGIAARDKSKIHAAILTIFRNHRLHIVRVRTFDPSGHLIFDLGGPHVLAPARTQVKGPHGGGVVGSLELAVQDDTGYIKLMQRFTRVAVILHERSRLVPGSSFRWTGGKLPVSGTVNFHGGRFRVRSFTGPKFPSGKLRVSLLQRVGGSA